MDFDSELIKCGVATEDGRQYVKRGVDPFHFGANDPVGIPDLYGGKSLLFNVERSLEVSNSGLAAGIWDCHVAFLPFLDSFGTASHKVNGVYPLASQVDEFLFAASTQNMGSGLVVCKSLTSLGATFNANDAATEQYSYIDLSDVLTRVPAGKFRVVSAAFKVVNTTAEIYKQGNVQLYRQSSRYDTDSVYSRKDRNGNWWGGYSIHPFQGPPTSLADACQLRGETWAAAEGCIMPIHVRPCYPGLVSQSGPLMITDNAATMGVGGYRCMNKSQYIPGFDSTATTGELLLDSDISGAYFTGLSEQSTLRCTLYITIECFASPSDSGTMAISAPTPMYDPRALECYSHLLDLLPVGARSSENAAGDWLRRVKSKVQYLVRGAGKLNNAVLKPVISMIPDSKDPRVMALKNGLTTTSRVIDQAQAGSKKKNKKLALTQ
jgi:hypothetical protein